MIIEGKGNDGIVGESLMMSFSTKSHTSVFFVFHADKQVIILNTLILYLIKHLVFKST